MRRKPNIILFTLVITATVLALNTQAKPDGKGRHVKAELSMPTVDQILDRHVRAVGGKNAYDKLTTRVARGTIRIQSGKAAFTGSYEDYAEAPNKRVQFIRVNLGNGAGYDTSHGFNGTIGWGSDLSANGVRFRKLSGTKLAAVIREANFYSEIRLKELYPSMTPEGKRRVAGRQFYVIEATPEGGTPETLYFDTKTGLLARRDLGQNNMAAGQGIAQTYYEDYKEVDGIMLPFTLRHISTGSEFTVKITEVRHNVPIEEAKFKSPEFVVAAFSVGLVDEYVQAEMRKQRIPGLSLALIKDGKIILAKGYGLANVEHQIQVKPETIFQSGSVGKQFTATAMMILVEEGKIALDDRINKYLDGIPKSWRRITVRHLLTNTAGLTDYPEGFNFRRDYTEGELLKRIERIPLAFKPGEKWSYSNLGYVVLGILIHKVTGKFYGDFIQDRIFKPLDMNTARIIGEADIIPNRAAGYRLVKGELKNQEWVSPTLNTTADGSLYLTAIDMAKWDAALYGEKILKKSSLDQMWTAVRLNNGKIYPYGFGWSLSGSQGGRIVEHSGSWQGFQSYIKRYIDDKLTIVVFANLAQADAGQIVRGIAAIYSNELVD